MEHEQPSKVTSDPHAATITKTKVEMRPIAAPDAGMRLDRWFRAYFPSLSHGALEKMLRKGQVRVNGARAKANLRLATDDVVRVPPMPVHDDLGRSPTDEKPMPGRAVKSVALMEKDRAFLRDLVLYEDDTMIALNKPSGLAVQGGSKTHRHIDGMLASLEKNGERPRLVHRLDRDTAGLLVLAKTRAAAAALGGAFQRHEVEKTYLALVCGSPRPREGRIDWPIAKRMVRVGRGDQERVVAADGEDAKKALTDFQTLEDAGKASVLALRPLTGRTHQLRVHCAAMGAPIVGDRKYGGPDAVIPGVDDMLHLFCRMMTFPHPSTGRPQTLVAPVDGVIAKTWRFFGFDVNAAIEWPELDDRAGSGVIGARTGPSGGGPQNRRRR